MRQLVSYDDIASEIVAKAESPPPSSLGSPPRQRRKKNNRQGQKWGGYRTQYRDGDYQDKDETPSKRTRRIYGLEEESRKLTHEEVWDDSALIRAWDAAVEEYEVLNGPEKKWKSDPVTKSPLWFNIPPETGAPSESSPGPPFLIPSIPAIFTSEGDVEHDAELEPLDPDNSHPVDFDTFEPRHDPSLSHPKPETGDNVGNDATSPWHTAVPPTPAGMSTQVTQNEAFERAMGAWYWAGYWTGVYHSKATPVPTICETQHEFETADEVMVDNIDQEEQVVPSEQVEDGDLLPT